ncbi:uncharacterized [Tachysurus ichikawai]
MVTVGNTWHIITPSHSGFGVMRWSSVISTRVLQALSQPEPSQSHWSGAEAGTAIWSSPSTLGMLRGKKKAFSMTNGLLSLLKPHPHAF